MKNKITCFLFVENDIIYGDLFVNNMISARRQSVDLNVDSSSIDSDSISFCSHTELEDTLAVAQIDAYINDSVSTSSDDCAAHADDNVYSLDAALNYDDCEVNLHDVVDDTFSKYVFSDCTDNPAGTNKTMQTGGPKECCGTKNTLVKFSGETCSVSDDEKVKLSFRKKSKCYKPNDV